MGLLRGKIVISWKLIGASVPKWFWLEAVTYVVYVINRMPSRVVDFRTPLQVLT